MTRLPDALPAPYDRRPDAHGVRPQPETVSLVRGQVDAPSSRGYPPTMACRRATRRRCGGT